MKKTLLVVIIAAASLIAGIGFAAQKGVPTAGATYDAAVLYAGDFKSDALVCRHSWSPAWKMIPRLERVGKVTCAEALASLNQYGTWKGSLNIQDGTCTSTAEGADWATGNKRNYDMIREETAGN